MKSNLPEIHAAIFSWWRQHGRVLPWRQKKTSNSSTVREAAFTEYFATSTRRDPYSVVVAELMLQQTQVDRVLPKYEAWMRRWPTPADLASATLAEVLIFWQGLGYNRRARFLWLLAKEIERSGSWPTTEKELRLLPGIGQYTARAVQSFAQGQHVGVVDTNIRRVLSRVFGEHKDYFALSDQVLPTGKADPWNQAIMDFGALICTAKNPKCGECPLQKMCQANLTAQQKGFTTYAAFLAQQKSPPKKTMKFRDTNRYFRGRIMDELRQAALTKKKLAAIMSQQYGLLDENRLGKLLTDLETEGLIHMQNNTFKIGATED